MLAAQLIAAHNAAMEYYRRAMIGVQTRHGSRLRYWRLSPRPVTRPNAAAALASGDRRRPKPWSAKRRYAVRLPKDLKPDKPGGLVQLVTVFVNLAPEKAIKHFTAYDPVAKWTVARAFNRATAKAASSSFDKLVAQMPFTVEAIQVDGGSEFKAEFEKACQQKGIRVYELPPKRPQLNGAVESM
jgi:hypothetical protein